MLFKKILKKKKIKIKMRFTTIIILLAETLGQIEIYFRPYVIDHAVQLLSFPVEEETHSHTSATKV